MLIEIRHANFGNKGSHLKLIAIISQITEIFPQARFVMAPHPVYAPFDKRIEMGFLQKAWCWHKNRQWGNLARFIPANLRKLYGIVLDREVDVVLDASDYAYGEHTGASSLAELSDSCRRWHRNGTKIILLPQAYGSFESINNRSLMNEVLSLADLVYATDEQSAGYLNDIAIDSTKVKIAPDYTILLEGKLPELFDGDNNCFAMVPNFRMSREISQEKGEDYVPFMVMCAKYLLEKDQKPFILIQEEKDLKPAQQISERLDHKINIIEESDPRAIKGILGNCKGTIGSRFHSLVNSLSQGVPSLATGWSNRFKLLLQQFNFDEGIVNVSMSDEEIFASLDMIINPESRNEISRQLHGRSAELKVEAAKMWDDVMQVISKKNKTDDT